RFAALSYVWGTPAAKSVDDLSLRLPTPAPMLIEDAIKCTQSLRLRYLWIDRYCIDQTATKTKHLLIQNMDKIYQGATVTIVNAANEGADHGLPGISCLARTPQDFLYIKGRKLIRVPASRDAIRNSKWSMRGWTYQEGLLSRRRLVFTNQQIYFQCLEMHTCESITTLFSSRPRPVWVDNPLSDDLQAFPWGVATQPGDITERISTYVQRELSYESDSLNAFMGILNQFWKSDEPLYHLWGLPFHTKTPKTVPLETQLSNALLWTPTHDNDNNLLRKRQSFPSWSWVAWENLTGIYEDDVNLGLHGGNNVSVCILGLHSNPIKVDDYVRDMELHRNVHQFSPRLTLTGWLTQVWFSL
ncbi:HET-domain-containing protein, partial [Paraphaeosphaeria sporulosa]